MDSSSAPHDTAGRNAILAAAISIAAFAAILYFTAGFRESSHVNVTGDLPLRFSNAEFWNTITGFSEAGGYFRSDNFLSNETGFQEIIPELRKTVKPGGVYIGVGPEQNFTYIEALRPRIAFIIDIRRQNMLEHLLYKAFMELADDRADFISLLFARPRPPGLGSGLTPEALFAAFHSAAPNSDLLEKNLNLALKQLGGDGIPMSFLSSDDLKGIRKVYEAFFESGPDLSYTFIGTPQRFTSYMPTYSALMTATDAEGKNWSYLATEERFEIVKQLQKNNLIVPLVGDFAGDKAIRTVGGYARSHGATVTVFYLSNVEQYLFRQNDDWSRFYANVATLPVDSTSMFIRSTIFGTTNGGIRRNRSVLTTVTSPIETLLRAYQSGQIHNYLDVAGAPSR